MTHGKTDLIIFDLGNVLVDFDFSEVVRQMNGHTSLHEAQIRHFFHTTPLWDRFERGALSAEEFFEALKKALKLQGLTFQAFTLMWNEIFTEKHDTVSILRRLRAHYRLAMLSNVNQMHWDYLVRRYAFMNWFDHPVASWAVGLRKPETEIFRILLERAGISPERAVFIDDVAVHIAAAQSVGIRAHQFQTAERLQTYLDNLLP